MRITAFPAEYRVTKSSSGKTAGRIPPADSRSHRAFPLPRTPRLPEVWNDMTEVGTLCLLDPYIIQHVDAIVPRLVSDCSAGGSLRRPKAREQLMFADCF